MKSILIALALALLPLLLLPACVSISLPPSGDKMGNLGRVEVGIRYFPPINIDWFNPHIPNLKDK